MGRRRVLACRRFNVSGGRGVEGEVRPQGEAVLQDRFGQGDRDFVVQQEAVAPAEDVAQDRRDDGMPGRAAVVEHRRDPGPHGGPQIDRNGRQAVGKHPADHRQR